MDTVLKNILISGVAVLVIVGMFAFVQLKNSQARIEEAELAVAELGRKDARDSTESGERVLLAAAYGWGPRDIPGIDMDLYQKCLAHEIDLRIFWDYTDVYYPPSAGNHYAALIEMPTRTEIYAESFNKEMLRFFRSSEATGCRIPQFE
jgi:hypothetical protein